MRLRRISVTSRCSSRVHIHGLGERERCAMPDGVLFCLLSPVVVDGSLDTGLAAAS